MSKTHERQKGTKDLVREINDFCEVIEEAKEISDDTGINLGIIEINSDLYEALLRLNGGMEPIWICGLIARCYYDD